MNISSLSVAEQLIAQHSAIKMLHNRVKLILDYIKAVESGEVIYMRILHKFSCRIGFFFMPPTSEKLRGILVWACPSVRLSVILWQLRNSRTLYARILKLHMWHVHEK